MKHTPGPWKVIPNGRELVISTLDNRVHIADVSRTPDRGMTCILEGADNARLIAAAPDLLEALKLARQYLHGNCTIRQAEEALEAAIAKAEITYCWADHPDLNQHCYLVKNHNEGEGAIWHQSQSGLRWRTLS